MSSDRTEIRPVPAAQYIRMSTEDQRYSLVNQAAAIAEYAERHGYRVVETYADAGKSGLSLKGRKALKQLLTDALALGRKFEAILVFDVSRWGRFQDSDQAGHYEFICRQAGLQVIYCMEPFDSDLSSTASIIKNIKRVMSSEYSRELSVRLSRAHLQQARLGFRQGGRVPYGFRRELRDDAGRRRLVLEPGQHKAILADKVFVVPGPPEELELIRRIFRMYLEQKLSIARIAEQLRSENIPSALERSWGISAVQTVLYSELCIGNYVYNRNSGKLQARPKENPEALWIRTAIMEPVVSPEVFWATQARLRERARKKLSDEAMLDGLRELLKLHGCLTAAIIENSNLTPSVTCYRVRFGGLTEALRLVGYERPEWQLTGGGRRMWSNDDILASLRACYTKYEIVSEKVINRAPECPSVTVIRMRFGSLRAATTAAGLPVPDEKELQQIGLHAWRAAILRSSRRTAAANGQIVALQLSRDEMLAGLRRLLKTHGYLTAWLIDDDAEMNSSRTVRKTFGTLLAAYALAGWKKTKGEMAVEALQRREPFQRKARGFVP